MKQHAIPQNILDIEFKLFTKFTVREFVYMAIGIGFGGIFLYFFTKGQLPGIIAIPVFFVSSAIGLVLGLVPINDQKADVFFRNYIWAITNPTQRVWRNDKLSDKSQITDKMEVTQGSMQRDPTQPGKPNIVGSESISTSQFIEGEKIEQLDREEQERLDAIGKQAGITQNQEPRVAPQQTVEKEIEQPKATSPSSILIARNTLNNFQTIPGETGTTIGFQILDKEGKPNSSAVVALKTAEGSVLFAQRTNSSGIVEVTKPLPTNRYKLLVQSNGKTYSNIEIATDNQPLPIIKLMLG
jgi:hypothetical protein